MRTVRHSQDTVSVSIQELLSIVTIATCALTLSHAVLRLSMTGAMVFLRSRSMLLSVVARHCVFV